MKRRAIEYILILLVGIATYLVFKTEARSYLFLAGLSAIIILSFLIRKPGPWTLIASRVFVGLVFAFSGYVKIVDPIGFMYKLEDYFMAMDLHWFDKFALPIAIVLSIAELLIGLGLIFKVRLRLMAWGALLFMALFLPLTLWLALTDAVKDCGCFGDAMVMTNWQTFYKNLVLMPFILIIYIHRKRFGWYWKSLYQWSTLGIITACLIALSVYCLRHEPIHDFRAWKVGSKIYVPQAPTVYIVYQNTVTGEKDQWLSADIPWQDSVWMSQWKFVETRLEEDYSPNTNYISMRDEYNQEQGAQVLHNTDFQLLVITYDALRGKPKAFDNLNEIYGEAEKDGVSMVAATATMIDQLEPFRHEKQIMYPFYWSDDITLKTVMRANPGLMLLKDGVILAKWHHNDLPAYQEIREKFIDPRR